MNDSQLFLLLRSPFVSLPPSCVSHSPLLSLRSRSLPSSRVRQRPRLNISKRNQDGSRYWEFLDTEVDAHRWFPSVSLGSSGKS